MLIPTTNVQIVRKGWPTLASDKCRERQRDRWKIERVHRFDFVRRRHFRLIKIEFLHCTSRAATTTTKTNPHDNAFPQEFNDNGYANARAPFERVLKMQEKC